MASEIRLLKFYKQNFRNILNGGSDKMPSTQVVEVAVAELTKFGYKDAAGYVSYSKKLSDGDKLKVVPGAKFEAEYYVADSGTRYLNKVFKTLQKADPVKVEKPIAVSPSNPKPLTVTPVAKVVADSPMTRQDWDAKDQRISRAGVIQAAVKAVAHFSSDTTDLFANAVALANDMLEFVNEAK